MGIKIKQIDFDGEGSSIVYNNNADKLEIYDSNTTKDCLFGENGKECKYEYIKE